MHRNKNHNKNTRKQKPIGIKDIPMHRPQLRIAEDVGVRVVAHLPEPDEGTEPRGGDIRTRRGVWDIRPGVVRANYGRGK